MTRLTTLFILVLCAGCGSKPKHVSYYQESKIDSGCIILYYGITSDTGYIDSTQFQHYADSLIKKGWSVQPILIPLTNHSEIK